MDTGGYLGRSSGANSLVRRAHWLSYRLNDRIGPFCSGISSVWSPKCSSRSLIESEVT